MSRETDGYLIVDGEVVDRETGEVVDATPVGGTALARRPERSPGFSGMEMGEVLEKLSDPRALDQQEKLAQAYEKACRALLAPSDVQKEGKREFKKKSAWGKLARHFSIDTELLGVVGEWTEDPDGTRQYEAEARVRGIAPWGQATDEVGACDTRESRFYLTGPLCPSCGGSMWNNREKDWGGDYGCKDKGCGTVLEPGQYDPEEVGVGERIPNPTARMKAVHDCKATAVTRARNRAISDLIAWGEVTWEEVQGGDHGSFDHGEPPPGYGGGSPPQSNGGGSPSSGGGSDGSGGSLSCPSCGGAVWDNRQKDWENAPDFRCKDKDGCGWEGSETDLFGGPQEADPDGRMGSGGVDVRKAAKAAYEGALRRELPEVNGRNDRRAAFRVMADEVCRSLEPEGDWDRIEWPDSEADWTALNYKTAHALVEKHGAEVFHVAEEMQAEKGAA